MGCLGLLTAERVPSPRGHITFRTGHYGAGSQSLIHTLGAELKNSAHQNAP
jgi:hypothetical protein